MHDVHHNDHYKNTSYFFHLSIYICHDNKVNISEMIWQVLSFGRICQRLRWLPIKKVLWSTRTCGSELSTISYGPIFDKQKHVPWHGVQYLKVSSERPVAFTSKPTDIERKVAYITKVLSSTCLILEIKNKHLRS